MRVYLSELALFLLISNKGVPFLFIFIPAPSTLFSVKEKKILLSLQEPRKVCTSICNELYDFGYQ